MTRNGIAYFKYKDFKKAVVTFKDTLQNVGMGMRVPELEEEEQQQQQQLESPMDVDYSEDDGTPKTQNNKRK